MITAAEHTFNMQRDLANAELKLDEIKFPDNGHTGLDWADAVKRAEKDIQPLRDEVARLQAEVGGRVFLIPEYNVPVLADKLAALNKRAEKLGVERVGMTEHESIERKIDNKYVVHTYVAVRGASPKLNGWQFAATLEHDENGVIVRRLPGLDDSVDLSAYRTASPENCDHCHQRRRRNDTYIVRHETGTLKQVGSSCLKDFLGSISPERIAAWLTFVADLLDDLDDDGSEFHIGGTAPARTNTLEYLTHISCMINQHGWISRSSAYNYGGEATADAASNNMFNQARRKHDRDGQPMWIDPTDADNNEAYTAIEHVRALPESELESDYVYNLFTALKGESIPSRQYGIAASAISFYQREVAKEIKARAVARSDYVGKVGDKIEISVTVADIKRIEDRYSYNGGTKPLYIMQDSQGNILKWFSSRDIDGMEQGAEGVVRGTIKAHDDGTGKYGESNFGKSTTLTRCKFEKIV